MSREKIIDVMGRGAVAPQCVAERRDEVWQDATHPFWDICVPLQKRDYLMIMDLALTALEAAGYAIVPVEPTEKMFDAACKDMGYSVAASVSYKWKDAVRSQWRAMLQSAKGE